jgi:hypothetical protein
VQAQPPDLVAAMLGDQTGGDPVEPRTGVPLIRPVGVAAAERGQERLGDQVVGRLIAETPGQVAVDVRGMSIEQRREVLAEQRGVVRLAVASHAPLSVTRRR